MMQRGANKSKVKSSGSRSVMAAATAASASAEKKPKSRKANTITSTNRKSRLNNNRQSSTSATSNVGIGGNEKSRKTSTSLVRTGNANASETNQNQQQQSTGTTLDLKKSSQNAQILSSNRNVSRYRAALGATTTETDGMKKARKKSRLKVQNLARYNRQQQQQPPVRAPVAAATAPAEPPPPSPSSTLDIDPATLAVLDQQHYRILKKINHGAYGQVYMGEYTVDNRPVAIKVIDLAKLTHQFREKHLAMEMKALIDCRHKNVVRIYDIIRCNNRLYIFMEFCPNGDLTEYVKCHGVVNEQQARYWFRQLIDALKYLHRELRMAHRDIKLDNVLLDDQFDAKLTDFGFTTMCWNQVKHRVELSCTLCGTQPYLSPQMLEGRGYNAYMADVWAMGVLLFVMINGQFPFYWRDMSRMLLEQYDHPRTIQSSAVPGVASPEAIDLVCRMCHPDETKRTTLDEVLSHPWLKRTATTAAPEAATRSPPSQNRS